MIVVAPVGPAAIKTYMITARVKEMILENRRVSREVPHFAVIRKWKWLSMNGCECNTPISAAAEYLTL